MVDDTPTGVSTSAMASGTVSPNSEGPLADPVAEARRVAGAVAAGGLDLRFAGGLGVALSCPSALAAPLAREYEDLDLAGRRRDHRRIVSLLAELGYVEDREFNALQSDRRLLVHDLVNGRQLDVFLDEVELCHRIDLRPRVGIPGATLSPADLLLMKLQVVETTRKDLTDILAILIDHPLVPEGGAGIDLGYLSGLVAHDWGLWRTSTMVAERAAQFAAELQGFAHAALVAERVTSLVAAFSSAPKSAKWRLRARIGDRARWYEVPEGKV